MSIVLTALSILASWAVSDMYSQSQHKADLEQVEAAHRNNLRTYALKAAEKVTNLSNELNRLGTYLQQELDYTEYRSTDEELQAKEERLESAIHLIGTLKSVNDTSLSDWQGVISDEIEEQREEMREKEQAMRAMLMDYEHRLSRQDSQSKHSDVADDTRSEIEALRRELQLAFTAMSGTSLPFHRPFKKRLTIEMPCPKCGKPVKFKQGTSSKSIKGLKCSECDARLVARYDDKTGPYLRMRLPVAENYICPLCAAEGTVNLDPVPGGVASSTCEHCGKTLAFTRATDRVRVRPSIEHITPYQAITSELIENIRTKLPTQPWPTGIHHQVAGELGVSASIVSRVIQELIRRKEFFPQQNGVVSDASEAALPASDSIVQ